MASWSGLLNIAKPAGITSRDAVDVVQRLVHPAKVGHAGTLDPLATGVLVVCIGHGTRLVPYVQELRKSYRGTFRLGEVSDTEDVTGTISRVCANVNVTESQLRDVLPQFVGRIEQLPPRVSALKVGGKRAYKLARRGEEFTLQPRTIEVDSLDLNTFDGVEFTLDIDCSGGTYVRSIGRDLGERLGCGALMTALTRTAIGPFRIETAVALEDVSPASLPSHLLPLMTAIPKMPQHQLTSDEVAAIRCGRTLSVPKATTLDDGSEVALVDEAHQLTGIGVFFRTANHIQPRIVFPLA